MKSIHYRKTHDIAELLDILADNGIEYPDFLENAVELTPFAVEFRYDFLPPEEEEESIGRFQRNSVEEIARNSLYWADTIISSKEQK